jgi:hypothetical protein
VKQYQKSAGRPEIPQNFRPAQSFFLCVEKPSGFFNAFMCAPVPDLGTGAHAIASARGYISLFSGVWPGNNIARNWKTLACNQVNRMVSFMNTVSVL